MTDTKDNSSLPLLFAITGSILAVAVGGWFFLGQQEPVTPTGQTSPVVNQSSLSPEATVEVAPPQASDPDVTLAEVASAVEVVDVPAAGIDAELRKARLAAEADILVVPAAQSALHYYGRILDAEGREEAILWGAGQLIHDHEPLLVIEINAGALRKQGSSPAEVFDWLHGANYVWEVITGTATDPQYDILAKPR